MPRWQKLLRHDALIHCYKEAVRNAMAYACPRVTGTAARADSPPAGMEPLEPRLLLSGSISGTVFADTDNDGVRDAGEVGMPGELVFIDLNDDRVYQSATEQSTTTNPDGSYILDQLSAGTYDVVAQDPTAAWDDGGVLDDVVVAVDEDVTGQDLGLNPDVHIEGGEFSYQGLPYELLLDGAGSFATSWDIDWGDGTIETVPHASSVFHTYTHAASTLSLFSITATVTDGTYTFDVGPQNFVMFASADYKGSDGGAANAQLLEGDLGRHKLAIMNPSDLTGITVDWGDGSAPEIMDLGSLVWDTTDSTQVYLPHGYDDSGTYTATFTVSRTGFDTVTTEAVITVGNAVPIINIPASATAVTGELVQLDLQATDPGVSDTIQKWRVLWGDEAPGTNPQEIDAVVGNPSDLTITHQYLTAGSYDIVIQAMDNEGAWTGLTPPVGDLNEDGLVGIEDLNIVLTNWNEYVPPADPRADTNGDGYVGLPDLNAVLTNWNKSLFSFTMTVSDEPIPAPLIFTVSTTDDELDAATDALAYNPGDLSLREALVLAANHPGQDTIKFDPALFDTAQTIALGGTELLIDSDINLLGPGADLLHIDAQDNSRIFQVAAGTTATISGITITNGDAGSGVGGGIYNLGDLTLTDSHLLSNEAGTGAGIGNATDASLTIYNSTLSGNAASLWGGGILNQGSASVYNSTLSGNTSLQDGGGIIQVDGTIEVINSTITGNRADSDGVGGGIVGGIGLSAGSATLYNSIVAGNFRGAVGADTGDDVFGPYAGATHNLLGVIDPSATGLSDPSNTVIGAAAPGLAPLGDYGGTTPTHALLPDNPQAINTGDNTKANYAALLFDQRGEGHERIAGLAVDLGASELAYPGPVTIVGGDLSISGSDNDDMIVVSVINNGTQDVIAINGNLTTIAATSVTSIHVAAGLGNDTIDLSQLSSTNLPNLAADSVTILGGMGDDKIAAGDTDSRLEGGAGDDTYFLYDNHTHNVQVTISDTSGNDTVDLSNLINPLGAMIDLRAEAGLYQFVTIASASSGGPSYYQLILGFEESGAIENVVGTDFDDKIAAGGQDNRLEGGAGDDTYFLYDNHTHDVQVTISDTSGNDTINLSNLINPFGADVDLSALPGTHQFISDSHSFDGEYYASIGLILEELEAIEHVVGSPFGERVALDLTVSTASPTQIDLSWTVGSGGATQYVIERIDPTVDFDWVTLDTTQPGTTTYPDASVGDGQWYLYRVTAVNNGVPFASSDEVGGVTPVIAPTDLEVSTLGPDQAILTWDNQLANATGYLLEWSTLSGQNFEAGLLGSVTVGAGIETTTVYDTFTAGTPYYFRVRGIGIDGEYSSADEVDVTQAGFPVAPTGLIAENVSGTQIDLEWVYSPSGGETGIVIERREVTNGGDWTVLTTVNASDLTHLDLSVIEGQWYDYRVRTKSGNVVSGPSGVAGTVPVSAPTNLSAIASSPDEVLLQWGYDSPAEISFLIEWSTDQAFGFVTGNQIEPADSINTVVSGSFASDTDYYFRVRAVGLGGVMSEVAEVLHVPTPAYPDTPTNFRVVAASANQIDLTWDDITGETGYLVERLTVGVGNDWVTLPSLAPDLPHYNDTDIVEGRLYRYRVRTLLNGWHSGYSDVISQTAAEAPAGFDVAYIGSDQAGLTWEDRSSGETGFIAEWSLTSDFAEVLGTHYSVSDATSVVIGGPFSPNTEYHFRIRAVYGTGKFSLPVTQAITSTAGPVAPNLVSAELVSNNQIDLAWDDVGAENGYVVERIDHAVSPDWAVLTSNPLPTNTQAYQDHTAIESRHYSYRIRAMSNTNASEASNVIEVMPASADVTNLAISPINSVLDEAHLTWTNVSLTASQYRIDWSLDENFTAVLGSPVYVDGYVEEVSINWGFDPLTEYFFRVRAYDSEHQTYSTGTVESETTNDYLRAPSDLVATVISDNQIDLGWDDISGEDGYTIQRASADLEDWVVIGTTLADDTDISSFGLSEGTTYRYRVFATKADPLDPMNPITSDYSDVVQETTRLSSPHPVSVTYLYIDNPDQARIAWSNTSSADTYLIEWSTDVDGILGSVTVDGSENTVDVVGNFYRSTEYTFSVTAINDLTTSVTVEKAVTTGLFYPNPPFDPAATAVSDTEVIVSWTWHQFANEGYRIDRRNVTDGGDWAEVGSMDQVPNPGVDPNPGGDPIPIPVTFSDTYGLEESHTYEYRVRAARDGYVGNPRDVVTATTYTAQPTNVDVEQIFANKAQLVWTDNSSAELAQLVEWSLTSDFANILGGQSAPANHQSATVYGNFEPNETYHFRVRSTLDFVTYSTSWEDETDTITVPNNPDAPTKLQAVPTVDGDVALSWENPATTYDLIQIERIDYSVSSDWAPLITLTPGQTSHTDFTTDESTSYRYRVRTDLGSQSIASNAVLIEVPPTVPDGFQVTSVTPDDATMTWTERSSTATGYWIDWSPSQDFPPASTQPVLVTAGGNGVTLSDANVQSPLNFAPGTTYYFRIRAFDGEGRYSLIAQDNYTTAGYPVTPTGLTATPLSHDSVELTWNDNADNETRYVIERTDLGMDNWGPVATLDSSGGGVGTGLMTHVDNNAIEEGLSYEYRVRAERTGHPDSAYSYAVRADVPPEAPVGLNVEWINATQAKLVWEDVSDNNQAYTIQWSLWSNFNDVFFSYGHFGSTGANDQELVINWNFDPGTTYHFKVEANSNYASSVPDVTSVTTDYFPKAPTDLVATVTPQVSASEPGTVDLVWVDNASNEDGFTLQRIDHTAGTGWEDLELSLDREQTSYNDASVTEGHQYQYRLYATNTAGDSAVITSAYVYVPYLAPTDLDVQSVSANSADLTWVKHGTAGTSYVIEWNRSPDFNAFSHEGSVTTPAGADSLTLNELSYGAELQFESGVTYYFRIYASDQPGFDVEAAVDDFTPTGYPQAPATLAVTAATPDQITLSWPDGELEDSYYIQRRDASTSVWDPPFGPIAQDAKTYIDTNVTEGHSYEYRIYAENEVGTSAYSPIAYGTTPPLGPDTLTVSMVSTTQVQLTWPDVSDYNGGYEIAWSPSGDFVNDLAGSGFIFEPESTGYLVNWDFDPNTEYHFRVRAFATHAYFYDYAYSDEVTASWESPDFPLAPSDFHMTEVAPGRVVLEWEHLADNNDAYIIDISSDGQSWVPLNENIPADATSYTDTTATEGQFIFYRLRASNTAGDSANTEVELVHVPPHAPSDFKISGASYDEVRLSWTNHSSNHTGYTVEWSTSPDFTENYRAKNLPANTTSFILNDLDDVFLSEWDWPEPGTAYYFKVRAHSVDHSYIYSESYSDASLATYITPDYPSQPTGLQKINVTPSQVDLTWDDLADNQDFYSLEVSGTPGFGYGQWTTLALIDGGDTSYTDTTVTEGASLQYRLRAVNNNGSSIYSNILNVEVPPHAPINVSVTSISPQEAVLTWEDKSYAEYRQSAEWSLTETFENVIDSQDIDANAESATVIGEFSPDTLYYFRVVAVTNYSSARGVSLPDSIRTDDYPATPSGLKVTATSVGQIDLEWIDNADTEDNYIIERNDPAAGDVWVPVGTEDGVPNTGQTVTFNDIDADLVEGKTFRYRVYATHLSFDPSGYSEEVEVVVPPKTPYPFTIEDIYSDHADLTWVDDTDSEIEFLIEWSLSPDFEPIEGSHVAPRNSNSAKVSGTFLRDTLYHFRISAKGPGGIYSPTETDSKQSLAFPVNPISLDTSDVATNQVILTWNNRADDEEGYVVERNDSTDPDGWIEISGMLPGDAVDYTDNDPLLVEGTTYYYRVRAYDDVTGYSHYSNELEVITQPYAPTGVEVLAMTGSKAYLSWVDHSENEALYRVSWTGGGGGPIDLPADSFSAVVTGSFAQGANITFKVRAITESGVASDVATMVVQNPGGSTAKPAQLDYLNPVAGELPGLSDGTDSLFGAPDLSWTAVSGADNYVVLRRPEGGSVWSVLPERSPNDPIPLIVPGSTTFTDDSSLDFINYEYGVIAVKNGRASGITLGDASRFYLGHEDYDGDGITNIDEIELGIDPLNPDTDGDQLPDGWEVQYDGFDPGVADDPEGDLDEDGVTNIDEFADETDPTDRDTDDDNATDGEEKEQGSDGNDPSDGGRPPQEEELFDKLRFQLHVGDQSGSQSEKWRLNVGDEFVQMDGTGGFVTEEREFNIDGSYKITIDWIDGGHDYDWEASLTHVAGYHAQYVIVDDNDPVLLQPETYHGDDENLVAGKKGFLHIFNADLDIDSDNDNELNAPDGSPEEEALEDDFGTEWGKLINVNNGDLNNNGIIDYADNNIDTSNFVPIVVKLSQSLNNLNLQDIGIGFRYSASDPNDIDGPDQPGDPYILPDGELRLWTEDKKFIDDLTWYDPSYFGMEGPGHAVTLYVEAVKPFSKADIELNVDIWSEEWNGTLRDTVLVSGIGSSLFADRNRDGIVSNDGADATDESYPFYFWLNDNKDIWGNNNLGPFDPDFLDYATEATPEDIKQADSVTWSVGSIDGTGTDKEARKEVFNRDLEDFARSVLWTSDVLLEMTDRIEFTLEGPDSGTMGIRIHFAGDARDSGTPGSVSAVDHLKEGSKQHNQALEHMFSFLDPYNDRPIEVGPGITGVVDPSDIHSEWFYSNDGTSMLPFLFEGTGVGDGILVARFIGDDNQVLSQSQFNLNLATITDFYKHSTIADKVLDDTDITRNPETGLLNVPTSTHYAEDSGVYRDKREDELLVFVHGWRMTPEWRRIFANTAYKRLYWSGYQGAFELFSWPTDFTESPPDDPGNFNRSDEVAWYSATGLANLLRDRVGEFGSENVNVIAHSMGGIVTSEALYQLQNTDGLPDVKINTAILTQAALSSHFYNGSVPKSTLLSGEDGFIHGSADTSSRSVDINGDSHIEYYGLPGSKTTDPALMPYIVGSENPRFHDLSAATNNLFNFFNPQDYALASWDLNNILSRPTHWIVKEIDPLPGINNVSYEIDNFVFSSGTGVIDPEFPPPRIEFRTDQIFRVDSQGNRTLLTFPDNAYEIYANAFKSMARAIGTTDLGALSTNGKTVFSENYNLREELSFGALPFQHSGQFHGTMADENIRKYWEAVFNRL